MFSEDKLWERRPAKTFLSTSYVLFGDEFYAEYEGHAQQSRSVRYQQKNFPSFFSSPRTGPKSPSAGSRLDTSILGQ